VLEIGSGHGVALTLVLDRLTDGTVTAVDRSATVLAAAHRRNAAAVATGRLRLVQAEWPDLDEALPGGPAFDVAFAIHVPVFRRNALAAAATVHRLIVPGGTFSLVAQPIADADVEPWVVETVAAMAATGLEVDAPLGLRSPAGPDRLCHWSGVGVTTPPPVGSAA
jgi:SAM-dependent methyltransferase